MSLLRLLTAGKSLVGLKDTGNRYSEARRGLLPKFGSNKNPFRASTRPDCTAEAYKESPADSSANEAKIENCNETTFVAPAPAPVPGPAVERSPLTARANVNAKTINGEESRPKGISRWSALLPWMRPKAEKPAIPKFAKSMIQGELSLDEVKVVRNDLSDSDLEIVPAKARGAVPQPTASEQIHAKAASTEEAWGGVTGQILGAGRT